MKDITFKLRKREKKHYLKVQEIHDDDSKLYKYSAMSKRDRDIFLNDDGALNGQNTGDSMMTMMEDEEVD